MAASATLPGLTPGAARWEAGLLAVALLNGFAPRAIHAVLEAGWLDALTRAGNVGLLEAVIAVLACRHVASGPPVPAATAGRAVPWALAGAALVPHGGMVWLALAAIALWRCGGTADRSTRAGYAVVLALSVHELWASAGLALLAPPILAAETRFAALAVEVLGRATRVDGNVLAVADGHRIVVLAACSVAATLSMGWVSVAAAATLAHTPAIGRAVAAGLALSAVLIAANTMRLALMAWNPAFYDILHGAVGTETAAAVATALTAAAACLAVPVRRRP